MFETFVFVLFVVFVAVFRLGWSCLLGWGVCGFS